MADNIEGPANLVLGKIRNRVSINEDDKEILSGYILAVWKRVPKARERIKETAPKVANELYRRIDEDLTIAAAQETENKELIEKNKETIKTIIDNFAEKPPRDVWEYNIPPERTPRSVEAVSRMIWQFLVIDDTDKEVFLTCDNPVFFFESIGIGRPESEMTFPISNRIALWTTWRNYLFQGYIRTTKQAIREINRRTVYNAYRYIFHSKDEDWVKRLVTKRAWQLHRLS